MLRIKSICTYCLLFLSVAWQTLSAQETSRFETSKQLEIFNALVKEVEMFYVDSVEVDRMIRRGIDAMLRGFDPYTVYIPEEEMDDFKYLITGEYGGIGSLIVQRGQGVVIAEPYEGMPAQQAGLKAGDVILAIDTIDVTNATTTRVSELLKGMPNSKVTLKIRRPGENKPRKIDLTRKQIVENQVPYYGVQRDSIGYISLAGFTEKSAQEVKSALEDLKQNHHIKGLVLDLRDNGGGILDGAVQIVNFFVPKGKEVVSTRGKIAQRDRIYRTSLEPTDTVMPIAVLINRHSASSTEIVCGALQDMDRAVLIGERSFGKGLVQGSRDLPYGGKIKVTMSKYYIPSGRCIQLMDYSHRREDGSVAPVPDSLTSVFYTSHGRPVRDGGGVRPDFEVTEKVPAMLYYLAGDDILFDYVTEWTLKHKTIPPVDKFVYPDEDFEDFKTCLREKGFSYDWNSGRYLNELREIADFEGYTDNDSTLFSALEAKLKPDLNHDLERYKTHIKNFVSGEIVKRYYFRKGEIIESLKTDNTLEKALDVLGDAALYRKTLSAPEPE
ncbi:MAG: S41 family peptidase [Tannerella sp.]|jgi:carboxyl-terminal processing protease|nr:S41 family peptidase [Tannerella sp.]